MLDVGYSSVDVLLARLVFESQDSVERGREEVGAEENTFGTGADTVEGVAVANCRNIDTTLIEGRNVLTLLTPMEECPT